MTTPEPEFCLAVKNDDSFTILQRISYNEPINDIKNFLDYEVELASYEEAIRLISRINWLEEIYSPPRA